MSQKALFFALGFSALLIIGGAAVNKLRGDDGFQGVSSQLFAMDTACTIKLEHDDGGLKELISSLDKELSAYDEASDVYTINSGESISTNSAVHDITQKSLLLTEKYPEVNCLCGALIDLWGVTGDSPKVPEKGETEKALSTIDKKNLIISGGKMRLENGAKLNFGSCAKGYALDRAKEYLESSDLSFGIVSFGSSSLLYGEKPDGKPFTTAIADPDDPDDTIIDIKTEQCFISTSGGYERYFVADGKKYCHIFDLQSGYPAETDLVSVTVISQTDGMLTDQLSTAIFIGGSSGLEKYLDDNSISVIAVSENKAVYCSDNIKDDITITNSDYKMSDDRGG